MQVQRGQLAGQGVSLRLRHWAQQWRHAMLECLPQRLRDIFGAEQVHAVTLRVAGEGFDVQTEDDTCVGHVELLRDGALIGVHRVPKAVERTLGEVDGPVVLEMPGDSGLVTQLTLPVATETNLRQVIAFEMDRRTPFRAEEVFFDQRITARPQGGKSLRVEVALIPRKRVEPLLELLEHQLGLRPERLSLAGRPELNLLPLERRPRPSSTWKRLNGAALAIIAVLAVAVVAVPFWEQQRVLDELEQRVAVARRQAEVVAKLKEQAEKAALTAQFVANRKSGSPAAIDVLAEVTRLLPQHTWVQQMTLENGELQIRGESGEASALVSLLENSPLFEQARFRSSVTANPRTGKERFHLSAQVVAAS